MTFQTFQPHLSHWQQPLLLNSRIVLKQAFPLFPSIFSPILHLLKRKKPHSKPNGAYNVRLKGFEPQTFGSVDRCSIQLSYRRIRDISVSQRCNNLTKFALNASIFSKKHPKDYHKSIKREKFAKV